MPKSPSKMLKRVSLVTRKEQTQGSSQVLPISEVAVLTMSSSTRQGRVIKPYLPVIHTGRADGLVNEN